jgi:hypothetical protein
MDNQTKSKFIKSIAIIGIFNGAGATLFLVAFSLSHFQVFLWSGLFVLLFTIIALAILFLKINKIKD